jgi:hypothetical protein
MQLWTINISKPENKRLPGHGHCPTRKGQNALSPDSICFLLIYELKNFQRFSKQLLRKKY